MTNFLPNIYRLRVRQLHIFHSVFRLDFQEVEWISVGERTDMALYLVHAFSLADVTKSLFLGYDEKPDEGFVSVPGISSRSRI